MPYTSLTTATQAGELKVLASTANDFPGLKNTTNATVRVNLNATGQWCLYNVPTTDPELVIFNSKTDWKGLSNVSSYNKYKWKAVLLRAGSLIAELKDAQGSFLFMLSAPRYIELAPGCSAEFFMNEDPRWYADNSGEITLSYTCAPAAPTPPPVMKDHQGAPPALAPEGSVVSPKKFISYAGIDFYPLRIEQPSRKAYLTGFKDGQVVKSFILGGPGYDLIQEFSIEPESEMLRFTNTRGVLMRMPWSSLVDTIPTPTPQMVVGQPTGGKMPWLIAFRP